MLLNEVQKQQRTIEDQQHVIAELTGRLDTVEQQLAAVSVGLDR
jgi:phosphoheptose isomerase